MGNHLHGEIIALQEVANLQILMVCKVSVIPSATFVGIVWYFCAVQVVFLFS